MAINIYKPWWIQTANPFEIEEEESIYPDGLLDLTTLSSDISTKMPQLWELAGQYDITKAINVPDPLTGESKIEFPISWSEEMQQRLQNPAERTRYLLDEYEPLSKLKEKSAYHNLNISFPEKWRYSVEEPFETGMAIGVPGVIASTTELAIDALGALDSFRNHLSEALERDFNDKETMFPFSSEEEKDFYKQNIEKAINVVSEEKSKIEQDDMVKTEQGMIPRSWMESADVGIGPLPSKEDSLEKTNKSTYKSLRAINDWAEKIAIKNIKALDKRHSKDLRFQAFQQYASNKPVGWTTTFQSPEYFTDTVLSMVPSAMIMGGTVAAGTIAGPLAAVGATMAYMPLEATGSYTEAYNWTMQETGDEELARSNAAWSTAGYLSIVAATEGFGALQLFNRVVPNVLKQSAKDKAFRSIYKNNITNPERIAQLKNLKYTNTGQEIGYAYESLKLPVSNALEEYVQISGNVLMESGYKGESQNIVDILAGNHPLVEPSEVHESVVGGFLFGSAFEVVGQVGNKVKFNDWNNKANTILNQEYGIETGIPNADVSQESLIESPIVIGDANPTLENYFKELLNPTRDEKTIVSRTDTKSPFGRLISNQDKYTNSALSEKIAESLLQSGQSEWDKVDPLIKREINYFLKGAVSNLNEDVLTVLDDENNIAQDILNKKIFFDTKRVGTAIQSTRTRKLKINDEGYTKSIIKMYESDIEKGSSDAAIKNYLSRERGIDIDKTVKKSVQKQVRKGATSTIQKQAEAAAERQVQEQIEREALNQLRKSKGATEIKDDSEESSQQQENVIGKEAIVLEGKFKNKSGKIVSYSPKQQLVKIELDDGTKIPAIKVSQVALTKPPDKQVEGVKPKQKLSKTDFLDKSIVSLAMERGEKDIPQGIINKYPDLAKKYGYKVTKKKKPSKVLKPTPSTVKKPVDNKVKLENRYSSLLSQRKRIVKNKGNIKPIDRAIAKLKKEIGDDRKIEDVFVEDKNDIFEAEAEIAELQKLDGVSIERAPTGKGYENRIGDIKIDKDKQTKGTGTKIVNAFKKLLRAKGRDKIEIDVNAGSEGFWEKQGFKFVEETREGYPIMPEDNTSTINPPTKPYGRWIMEYDLTSEKDKLNTDDDRNETIEQKRLEEKALAGDVDANERLAEIEKIEQGRLEESRTWEEKVNPIIKAEMKIKELSEMEGVTIDRDLPNVGYENRIGNIEVIEELRKKGIGTKIVNAFKDLFKAKNKSVIEIIARPGSEDFWVKQGFEKYGQSSQLTKDKNGNMVKPDKMRFWLKDKPLKQESIDIDEDIQEDSAKLSESIQNFSSPLKLNDYFEASYKKIKDKYGIDVSDFVVAMHKSLKVIENKDQRNLIKNLLAEWAVSIDPEISSKMRNNNDSLKIVELMGFSGKKKKRIQSQISDLNVINNIVNALDKSGAEDSHDISREGLSISDVSDVEEISNNMTFEAYDFLGDRFFKFLETTSAKGFLNPKQTAELMEEVSVNDYDGFVKFVKKKYKFTPETIFDSNMLKNFWIRNQPANRQDASDRPSLWWANMTNDGRVLDNKNDKRFIPKIGGHPKYGKDIRNNQDLPKTVNVSFFDYDNKTYDWNFGNLQYSRLYLKDVVDVFKGEDKGGFYSKQSFIDLTGSMVRGWDSKLAQFAEQDGLARTIISVKSGGNSPSFIIVKASKEIMDIASDEQGVIDYFDYEVSINNMTEEMKQEFLDSISNEAKNSKLNNFVESQHILMHEVMKRARGRDYLMRTSSASHHSRRLAIDDGDGIIAIGTGDYTVKIIDQSKTFVSKGLPDSKGATKKIPMSSYVGGLPDKYHGDGSLWVESEFLDTTAEVIGRVPSSDSSSKLREIKTRIRFISKDDEFGNTHYRQKEKEQELGSSEILEGTHYLAMKHNEFVPEEDIYITDENDNIIVYTSNVNGNIRIFDGEDNRITMFGTLDEAKEPDGGSGVFKLDGRVSTDILTLPEQSRRIVKIPKQQGHNSAAFPWSWLSHLHNSKFDSLRNALTNRMLNVAKVNMDTLFSTRNNPQVMRALMGQMKSDGLSIMNEVDRLLEPSQGEMISDGFFHPHIITGMVEPIKNRMLKENSYGGRRRGFGSYPAIKSDLSRTIVKKEDGVVISADDVTMTRFLKDLLNVSGFGNELIENINEALRTRKEYLMVGRWPVYTPSAVFLARVEKVIPSGHGAVVWFHPESIVGKMQADHDGDTSFLLAPYFGQNYKDRTIITEMNSNNIKEAFDEMDSFVRLEYFQKTNEEYKLTKKADTYIVSGKLGKGINSQGVLMNSVSFLEDMYFKGFKAEIGGQVIVARNPDEENMVMSYAKLKDEITQEMLDSAKMGTLVSKDGNDWESGDKYLKTTPIKQLHILLQAAVDNAKEFILADWGYNGYKTIIPKMFVQENGSPIGSKQISSITSLIRKELMNNLSRRGVSNKNNRSQDISEMFETSKEIYEMNNLSGVEKGQRIRDKGNARRLRYGPQSRLAKNTMEIESLTFNNKLTSLEQLIAVPHKALLDYETANPNDKVHEHPLGYHPNRIVRAIMQTQKDLFTIQKGTERWYPETKEFEKNKEVARRFTNEMTREFYRIMMSAQSYQDVTKSRITSSGYPYQEKIIEFIDKWLNKGDNKKGLPSWKSLSIEQQQYSTLRFLRGVLKFSPQFQKKIGVKETQIINSIVNLREKINEELNLKTVERLENKIKTLESKLDKLHEPNSYLSLSRSRDIEKMLPMPLMSPEVWTEFANRFGPNLREASSEKINLKSEGSRYEDRNTKSLEQLLKDCP